MAYMWLSLMPFTKRVRTFRSCRGYSTMPKTASALYLSAFDFCILYLIAEKKYHGATYHCSSTLPPLTIDRKARHRNN